MSSIGIEVRGNINIKLVTGTLHSLPQIRDSIKHLLNQVNVKISII